MRQFLVVAFAFCYFIPCLVADEPGSKPSAADLLRQLQEKEPQKVCVAAKALGERGPANDAVPALKKLLKHRNGRVKWTAAEALWRLEHKGTELAPVFAELLLAQEVEVRAAAAWRLGRLGSDARPAVLLLAACLRDENFEVRVQAGQALTNLGPFAEPALPALVRALRDKQLDRPGHHDKADGVPPFEGEEVVVARNGPRTSPALPALIELADHSIPLLIETFGEATEDPNKVRLEGGMDGSPPPPKSEVAARVTVVFPAFGARGVSALIRALDSKHAETRRFAVIALQEVAELNGLPETAITRLEKALDDPDKAVQRQVARTLGNLRPSSAKAFAIIQAARKEGKIYFSEWFGDLQRMSAHNAEARKILFQLLEDDKDAETARAAHHVLAKIGLPGDEDRVRETWIKALSHADKEMRSEAIRALSRLGAGSKRARIALREQLKKEGDYHNRAAILDALTVIDPDDAELIPLLVKHLDDPESWVGSRAIQALADLGPKAKDALGEFETRLLKPKKSWKGRDEWDARRLVKGIVQMAPGSTKSAAILMKALRNADVRGVQGGKNSWFMRDLLEDELTASLPVSAPLLREALKDKDPYVRRSAALVLVQAGIDVETTVPVLLDQLWAEKPSSDEKDWPRIREQERFQHRAVGVLMRRRHPQATRAVAAAWCAAWQTAKPDARKLLERGLIVFQPEALPHLLEQLRQAKSERARRELAHLLARFEGQGKHILPILREELGERQNAAQYAAMQALAALGPDAADAVPDLLTSLKSQHPGMRAVAAQTLARIGRPARPAVPALKAMLKENKPDPRISAALALSQIDPEVTEALTVLREALLSDKSSPGRESIDLPEDVNVNSVFVDSVEQGILRFGDRSVTVLAEILDNVDLDEWSLGNISTQCGASSRLQAARLLARLGPDAMGAVPALVLALKDRDPFIRDAAASALGRIGPAAKQAAPDFIALLEQKNRALGAGTWSSGARFGSRFRNVDPFDYQASFDFRSLGRERLLADDRQMDYGPYRDPYAGIRPSYPYDPVYVLGRIDGETRSAQPLLNEIARDAKHPDRFAAAMALRRTGCDSPDLMPTIMAALADRTFSLEMRDCLEELDTQLTSAIPAMIEWLKHSAHSGEAVAVLDALGRLGDKAGAASDVIRPLLAGRHHWQAHRRVAATLALVRIRGDKDLAFPVLRDVLMGEEEQEAFYYSGHHLPDFTNTARVHAARALGVLLDRGDQRAREMLSTLAKGDENPHVRVAALEALARQKQTNEVALKALCALLHHPTSEVRSHVAAACGRLAADAKISVPALKMAAGDENLEVRQAARQALQFVH